MAPSDNSSYKIPTRSARKPASREVDFVIDLPPETVAAMETAARQLATDLDRVLDAACPIWPGERKRYAMARYFSLDRTASISARPNGG